MPNTSATGGYLLSTTTDLNDDALADFFHDVIVGVTGLPNDMVRPAWQPNPPVRPDISVDWCGFAIQNHLPEAGYAAHLQDENGASMQRHETLDIRCSFYGPNADAFAAALAQNLQIGQNQEELYKADMAYVGCSEAISAPELVNDILWYNREDITATIRRQLNRQMAVLPFLSVGVDIKANT